MYLKKFPVSFSKSLNKKDSKIIRRAIELKDAMFLIYVYINKNHTININYILYIITKESIDFNFFFYMVDYCLQYCNCGLFVEILLRIKRKLGLLIDFRIEHFIKKLKQNDIYYIQDLEFLLSIHSPIVFDLDIQKFSPFIKEDDYFYKFISIYLNDKINVYNEENFIIFLHKNINEDFYKTSPELQLHLFKKTKDINTLCDLSNWSNYSINRLLELISNC